MSTVDQVTYWNEIAGAKWVANAERLDRIFTPLTQALFDAAAPKPGEQVVDVGCGCGEMSLLASRAGAEVRGIDISRPMLARAHERVPGVTFIEGDAMIHGFAPEADLLISRFGVMFFADKLAAFRNLRRALKPGGRLAFLCWRPRPEVEWMQWPLDQIAAILPAEPPVTGEPGPFGLADAEETCRLLEDAGFSGVAVDRVDARLVIGEGTDPVADAMVTMRDTGPAAVLFRDATPDQRGEAEARLVAALGDRVQNGQLVLGGACWLYRARA